MNRNDKLELIAIFTIVGVLMAGMMIQAIMYENLRKQAIKHGAAEYNATTGEWQWKTNNVKPTAVEFSIRLTNQ